MTQAPSTAPTPLEETSDITQAVYEMRKALHDLCQPLTALQCRLEMAELTGNADDYQLAVSLGLAECSRMSRQVFVLREILRSVS